jgi:hypothetical protein
MVRSAPPPRRRRHGTWLPLQYSAHAHMPTSSIGATSNMRRPHLAGACCRARPRARSRLLAAREMEKGQACRTRKRRRCNEDVRLGGSFAASFGRSSLCSGCSEVGHSDFQESSRVESRVTRTLLRRSITDARGGARTRSAAHGVCSRSVASRRLRSRPRPPRVRLSERFLAQLGHRWSMTRSAGASS